MTSSPSYNSSVYTDPFRLTECFTAPFIWATLGVYMGMGAADLFQFSN